MANRVCWMIVLCVALGCGGDDGDDEAAAGTSAGAGGVEAGTGAGADAAGAGGTAGGTAGDDGEAGTSATGMPACGNGPPCDPDDLGGETCSSQGAGSGILLCDEVTCNYVTALCSEGMDMPMPEGGSMSGTMGETMGNASLAGNVTVSSAYTGSGMGDVVVVVMDLNPIDCIFGSGDPPNILAMEMFEGVDLSDGMAQAYMFDGLPPGMVYVSGFLDNDGDGAPNVAAINILSFSLPTAELVDGETAMLDLEMSPLPGGAMMMMMMGSDCFPMMGME